jgi:hypothetical protein
MAPAIGEMVSACFYDNELKTGVIEPFDKPYQEDMVRVVPNIYLTLQFKNYALLWHGLIHLKSIVMV